MKPELERTPMPDVTEEKPKPCPFCGSRAVLDPKDNIAECPNPDCPSTEQLPLDQWNHRPAEARLEAELLSLRKSSHSVSQCCPMSERLQKRVEDLESQCVDYDADVKRFIARVTELEAIVSQLPKTKDGKPITRGSVIYCPNGHKYEVQRFDKIGGSIYCCEGNCWSDGCQSDDGGGTDYKAEQCYSTREAAAEASAKGVKGGN